ncbi:putative LRR receptor-like serine/threonine-protein kinase [Platanthera guangdongensis]|uniref:LRR receptor-like serine/threonine-protein kinase n=1 Tax=Platanthera guangdongensis TaxID=2320717 RepID=A0ABR2MEY1_9ASPA
MYALKKETDTRMLFQDFCDCHEAITEVSNVRLAPASCAYDVYCFGKVLLELVTGKLGISGSNGDSTMEWLEHTLSHIDINEKEPMTKIIDPSLVIYEDLLEEVWAMSIVARSCLNPKPSKRPLMKHIRRALENPLKVIREDSSSGSVRLRDSPSQVSWNAAFFGSWRHNSQEIAPATAVARRNGKSLRQSSTPRSQGSASEFSSHGRHSKEIFPEPQDMED